MAESILKNKSYVLIISIVKLSQFHKSEKKKFLLIKQILRRGTAIGALVRETEFGQSKADFVNKMSIALKEANETEYWLCILKDTNYTNEKIFESMQSD